jgi:hypothetical protein
MNTGNFGLDYREKYNLRLKKAAEIALSKHNPVEVGNTRFGKTKLMPVCIACDRPFGKKSSSPEPSNEGVQSNLGVGINNNGGMRAQSATGRSNNIGSAKKHITRGGFRMPKSASSPLFLEQQQVRCRKSFRFFPLGLEIFFEMRCLPQDYQGLDSAYLIGIEGSFLGEEAKEALKPETSFERGATVASIPMTMQLAFPSDKVRRLAQTCVGWSGGSPHRFICPLCAPIGKWHRGNWRGPYTLIICSWENEKEKG